MILWARVIAAAAGMQRCHITVAAIRASQHQHSGGLHQCCGIKSWLHDGSVGSFRFNELLRLCLCQVDFKPELTEVHRHTLITPGIPGRAWRTDPG